MKPMNSFSSGSKNQEKVGCRNCVFKPEGNKSIYVSPIFCLL